LKTVVDALSFKVYHDSRVPARFNEVVWCYLPSPKKGITNTGILSPFPIRSPAPYNGPGGPSEGITWYCAEETTPRYRLPFPLADQPKNLTSNRSQVPQVSHNLQRCGCDPLTRRVPRQTNIAVASGGLVMPSANTYTIDVDDSGSHSQSRAYSNKPRDHARQNRVETPGNESSGASDVVWRIDHCSEKSLILRLTCPRRHLRTGLQTLNSRWSCLSD